jgi:hypothetical protein
MKLRYGNEYDKGILEKYKKIELDLSRDNECYGTSWSCSIIACK